MSRYHEEFLIGTVLRHQEVFDNPLFPAPGDFIESKHSKAVGHFSMIKIKGGDISWAALYEVASELALKLMGGNYDIGVPGNIEFYMREIRKDSARRSMKALNRWLETQLEEDPLETLGELVTKAERVASEASGYVEIYGKPHPEMMREAFRGPQEEKIATGFEYFDSLLEGGFTYGAYVVGTGPTGEGKSTFSSQLALQWGRLNHKVWYGSFEMAPARTGKIMMVQGGMSPVERNLEQAEKVWHTNNIILSGTIGVLHPEKMAYEIAHFIGRGVRIFIVDNLTVMEAIESGERYEKQVNLMQKTLRMAMENQVLFIMLAHLRKGVHGNPSTEDITGAGVIGQLADAVWMISKGGEEGGPDGWMRILKSRTHGMGKSFGLAFNPHTRTYSEVIHG